MNTGEATKYILKLFPVNSEVNLYESYTEFWAEIMNASACSFFLLKNKTNIHDFLINTATLIHYERTYSFFQLVKTLRFMGLTYKDIYSKNNGSQALRQTMYKEHTSVLSYYILKTVLLNNYPGFLYWCKSHNLSLLQFNKTPKNLNDFCVFIEKNYKRTDMLDNVDNTELLLADLYKDNKTKTKNEKTKFILSNMRMSICEMG